MQFKPISRCFRGKWQTAVGHRRDKNLFYLIYTTVGALVGSALPEGHFLPSSIFKTLNHRLYLCKCWNILQGPNQIINRINLPCLLMQRYLMIFIWPIKAFQLFSCFGKQNVLCYVTWSCMWTQVILCLICKKLVVSKLCRSECGDMMQTQILTSKHFPLTSGGFSISAEEEFRGRIQLARGHGNLL